MEQWPGRVREKKTNTEFASLKLIDSAVFSGKFTFLVYCQGVRDHPFTQQNISGSSHQNRVSPAAERAVDGVF